MEYLQSLTGTAALALCVGSYLLRTHLALTLAGAAGVFMWAIHFGCKQAWTPCVLSALMGVRVAAGLWVVEFTPRTRWTLTTIVWGLTLWGTAWTWQGPASAPSFAASMFLAYAGFHLRYRQLRWALLHAELLWLFNGWLNGSTLAAVAALAGITLNLAVLWRERPSAPGQQAPTPQFLKTPHAPSHLSRDSASCVVNGGDGHRSTTTCGMADDLK